jgi:hypothetical protein
MLHFFPTQGDDKTGELGVLATNVLWLDLLNPTSAEMTNVEETVGATLPSLGALSEIETSSRLRNQGGVLYMSTPSAARHPEGAQTTPPLGFVLSAGRLITVRFMPLPAFDAVAGKFASNQDAPKSSLEVFTLLCEEIVDRVADILEHLAAELNVCRSTPSTPTTPAAGTPPAPTASSGCNCGRWVVWATGSRRCATGCRVWGASSPTPTSMPASGPTGRSSRAWPVCARTSIP